MQNTTYTESRPLRVFTAFSGYDSQCMALDRLEIPYELTGWSEIDRFAIQAHNAIYPQWADRNYGDISKIDWDKVPDFDLLTYSFPCTCVSVAGKQEGFVEGSGTASSLLWECRKAIVAKRPKYLLMENVKALVSQKFKPLFMKWQDELASYGYTNFFKVLNAKDYGVPQNRERVFMVSILDDDASYHFPEPFPLERRLKDILEENVDAKYYLSDKLVRYIFSNGGKDKNIKGGTGVCDGSSVGEATLTAQYYKSGRQSVYLAEKKDNAREGQEVVINNRRLHDLVAREYIPEDSPACLDAYNGKIISDGTVCTITTRVDASNGLFISEPFIYDDYNGRIPQDPTIARTVTPNSGSGTPRNGQKVIQPVIFQRGRGYIKSGVKRICPSITTSAFEANNVVIEPVMAEPQVLTPRRNEYGKSVRKAYESGEVEESRHNMTDLQPREDGIANTLTSVQKDNLLIEPQIQQIGNIVHTGNFNNPQRGRIYSIEGISPAINTMSGGDLEPKILLPARGSNKEDEKETCPTVSLRIRKLTEREAFRLMDVSEENIDRIQGAGISRSQQYKMAGNSIVVSCLYHIFRKMFIDTGCEGIHKTLF